MKHPENMHHIRWLIVLVVLLSMGSACTHIKPVPVEEGSSTYTLNLPWKQRDSIDSPSPSYMVSGKASWYGKRFHRRRTASGERFDMYGYTAAHRTLPFGTRLLVTHVDNGKSVVVKVNDRGPHSRRLVIDLSYAAARKIGMKGCADVTIEKILGPTLGKKGPGGQSQNGPGLYSLQAGSFQSLEKAQSLLAHLDEDFEPVVMVSEKGLYKVRVGSFEDPHQAGGLRKDLENRGFKVFTVKMTPETVALAERMPDPSVSHEK